LVGLRLGDPADCPFPFVLSPSTSLRRALSRHAAVLVRNCELDCFASLAMTVELDVIASRVAAGQSSPELSSTLGIDKPEQNVYA
jgi:hypothetical protein